MWQNGAGGADMRQLFLQDQSLLARLGLGGTGGQAEAHRTPGASQASAVGWGGQPIASDSGRVPWFGRNRNKAPAYRQARAGPARAGDPAGARDASCSAGAPGAAPFAAAGPGARSHEDVMSVEELVQLVRRLGRAEPLPDRVFRTLHHLDSRAVALLLKDLAKAGQEARSVELFDALRALPERHLLRGLCDVYTYTATISLCIYHQNVDRAMELLAEMRARGVERNVHTYTALMNVCIKCGRLSAALDIFQAMRAEGCTPNVVTYNTLIDVHGKLGQWERAVGVLRTMRTEGVVPALRTYNTLIIACNMCSQPREALAVYSQLREAGFEANSTTYNALISAYGKMGQLDKVLEVYREMVWKGLERSVITYSSLISACEKAGRWETALELFDEMQRDGCSPNTVTYNSLITACGQGCQWEKARQVFDQMQANGCTPDVVTFTALISALERGGQWQLALDAFGQMVARGCRPDAIVFNAIIDALWQTGVVWAQAKARELFAMAVKQGHFRNERVSADGARSELNLHALTAGVAMLSLHSWLQDMQRKVLSHGDNALPLALAVVTDAGNASREQGNFIIKEAVSTTMSFWGAPFRAVQDKTFLGVLEAPGPELAAWVRGDTFGAMLASLFPAGAADQGALSEQLSAQLEFNTQSQCSDAFGAVQRFEASHNLSLQSMSLAYLQQRPALVGGMLDHGAALALRDEVVHDGVLLLDRAASTAAQVPQELLPLVAAAALQLSVAQGGAAPPSGPAAADGAAAPQTAAALAEACGVDAAQLGDMCWQLRQLLDGDTLAISTMRCLKVYLERIGYRYLDKQGIYVVAGLPIMLAVESLFDMSLLNCRPSVVAAALLYAERRQRGAVPFWPSALARMTGYDDLTTPELACAVRAAQKLCRKLLYSQIYKAQSTTLAAAAVQQQQQQVEAMCRAYSGGSGGSGGGSVSSGSAGSAPGAVGSLAAAPAAAAMLAEAQGLLGAPQGLGGLALVVPAASAAATPLAPLRLDPLLLPHHAGPVGGLVASQLVAGLPGAGGLQLGGGAAAHAGPQQSAFAAAAAGSAVAAAVGGAAGGALSQGEAAGLESLALSLAALGIGGPGEPALNAASLDAALSR